MSPENGSVAAPGVEFSIKNIGQKPAMLVTNDEEIKTLDAGRRMVFIGDESFDYYIKTVTSGDTTTIEFCKY